ncbi:MAG TPA: glycosyltransferase [Gemmatimonadales bacterium]|nr:glycosyltransferase [Gemmatimonadales bacterium]
MTPLRVLHVIWWGEVGGIALNLVDLARHARAAGHAMSVVVLARSSPLIDALSDHGVRVMPLGARSGRDLLALARFARLLRRERFDVIHDHTGTFLAALAIRIGAAGARTIHQEHGAINVPLLRDKKRAFYRLFGRGFDRFIAVSRANARDMLRAGAAAERVITIPNAVDPERFSPGPTRADAKRALGLPQTAATVGTACRLVPEKDLPLFLDVARLVRQARPDVVFAVVGSGPDEEPLRRACVERGLADAVRFPGVQSDMAAVWRAFDVYLFTSRVESFGRTLLEAQACETPVVAAVPLEGGAIDLVRDSPGVVRVAERDAAELARRTLELLDRPERRAETGRAGRQWVTAQYHVADWVRQLDGVYRTTSPAHADTPTPPRNRDTMEDIEATR